MKRTTRLLAIVALLALIFTVPAAVIARGERDAAEQSATSDSEPADEEEDEQLEEFEPTERINADESISFPVDI